MITERVVTVYFKYGHTCNSINKVLNCKKKNSLDYSYFNKFRRIEPANTHILNHKPRIHVQQFLNFEKKMWFYVKVKIIWRSCQISKLHITN